MTPHPAELLAAAFSAPAVSAADRATSHRIRWRNGSSAPLDLARWLADAGAEERALLSAVRGPVLDVGCGPGRHVAALSERGVHAVGIDVLPDAVRLARGRGARVIEGSVFGDVPGSGTWATVLLLDGNVGIGGDPVALLRRVRDLLMPGGTALCELEPRGVGLQRGRGRLETPQGHSRRFAWGRVGVDGVDALATAAGFRVATVRPVAGRWFADLIADAPTPGVV